jgi:hypothetical protein
MFQKHLPDYLELSPASQFRNVCFEPGNKLGRAVPGLELRGQWSGGSLIADHQL